MPSRTQSRLQKHDAMLLNNERLARTEGRRRRKRRRGSIASSESMLSSAEGSECQSADILSEDTTESGLPAMNKFHEVHGYMSCRACTQNIYLGNNSP